MCWNEVTFFPLFLELEREGTDEVSVAEEINGVEAFFDFLHGAETGAVIGFSGVLEQLRNRVGYLPALESEEAGLALVEECSVRVDDADEQILDSRLASDILRDGEVPLQFAYMRCDACFPIILVKGSECASGDL